MSVLLVSVPAHSGVGDFKHAVNILNLLIERKLYREFDMVACVVFCSQEQQEYFSEELKDIAKYRGWNQKFQYMFIITRGWGHHYDRDDMKTELKTLEKFLPTKPTHIIEISHCRIVEWLRSYPLHLNPYFDCIESFIYLGEYGFQEPRKSQYTRFNRKPIFESLGPLKKELGLFVKRQPVKKNLDVFNRSKLFRNQKQLLSNHSERCYVVLGYEQKDADFSIQMFISRIQDFQTSYKLLIYKREDQFCDRDREYLLENGTEVRGFTPSDTDVSHLLKKIRKNQGCVLLTKRLPNREYQQIMTQPIRQASYNIIYFILIGGDNTFTECVDVSLEGNVVPIFCMPVHKINFILNLVIGCSAIGLQLLSEHIYASSMAIHDSDKFKQITYISDATKSFFELQEIAVEWHKYCEYLREHKNAYKILSTYLGNAFTSVAPPGTRQAIGISTNKINNMEPQIQVKKETLF